MVPSRQALVGAILFLAAPAPAAAPPAPTLPRQALAVLTRHCASCHGGAGKAKGGFGYVLDRHRLVSEGQVIPGKALVSPLYQRIHDGEMPPPGKGRTFSPDDAALLARWIDRGAPAWDALLPTQSLSPAEVLRLVRADRQALPARQRRFVRYLSLAGLPPTDHETLRRAVAKLVNSLSWHARLAVPVAIDPGRVVLRLDLRDYRWTAPPWDRLAAGHPYRLAEDEPAVLRADWFVATASRPPFYHDLLALPGTASALERQLGVDAADSRANDTALRAGFNNSGVARSNRVLERHDSLHGTYWRSFDFSDNRGRQNIFEFPLGPEPGPAGFRAAGGEMIFHLPNGLQGYFVVDADGRRIDRAPGEIVSDPQRPDRIVETGLSCIGCHARGILPKEDQVRAHVRKNARAFGADVRDSVFALYAPAATLRRRIAEDNRRFGAALKSLGIGLDDREPVLAVVLRYEETLDLARAATELGVPVDRLQAHVRGAPELGRTLGPLLAARGSVQRAVFEDAFPGLFRDLAAKAEAISLARKEAFRGHKGAVRALAWGPGGKPFASAGEDGTVRLWDAGTGTSRLLARHAGEVLALAFSGDGKRLVWGGADRLVHVWDASSGRLVRLAGHTDAVRAVVVSADGRTAVSGGADRSLRVWDLEARRPLRAWTAHAGTVTALALSADGRLVVSAGADRTARVWQLPAGTALARHDHPGAVRAVAFAADGKTVLTGGSDGAVRLWQAGRSNPLRRLARHDSAVVAVAQSLDGRTLFSLAEREAGEALEAAAIAPDGTALLARGGAIRTVPLASPHFRGVKR